MCSICGETCEARNDLSAAAAGLAEVAQLLSESTVAGSDDLVEAYYAMFRAARSKFCGARAAYTDHIAGSEGQPVPTVAAA